MDDAIKDLLSFQLAGLERRLASQLDLIDQRMASRIERLEVRAATIRAQTQMRRTWLAVMGVYACVAVILAAKYVGG